MCSAFVQIAERRWLRTLDDRLGLSQRREGTPAWQPKPASTLPCSGSF